MADKDTNPAAAPSALGRATTPAAKQASNPDQAKMRPGSGAEQAFEQERQAVTQMGEGAQLGINEGGRTNDSHEQHNPEGAVHGLPKPALKGTWR